MSRGQIGDNKESIAYSKLEKQLRKDRTPHKKAPNGLLESLQEMYPQTWKQELQAMKDQHRAAGPYTPPNHKTV